MAVSSRPHVAPARAVECVAPPDTARHLSALRAIYAPTSSPAGVSMAHCNADMPAGHKASATQLEPVHTADSTVTCDVAGAHTHCQSPVLDAAVSGSMHVCGGEAEVHVAACVSHSSSGQMHALGRVPENQAKSVNTM
eukprot:TRINITY_DN11366_c0_g1_i1.p2 TRINITY_DN11366_c0_g1~~TRINITY_DN11366_c0_g1_i1.p2  ORF type:complete len:138 (-),score=13.19 TRINITY_DN11366_c0_g1_i1:25-438(-)